MSNPPLVYSKVLSIAGTIYTPVSLVELTTFPFDGQPAGGSTPPTSWANPTNTTNGGLMQAAPAAGSQQWLKDVVAMGPANTNANNRIVMYDRLAHMSGLSGTVTTAQTITGGPMTCTRWSPNYSGPYTNPDAITGDGNEILLEVYTNCGVSAQTVTATYTNSAGTAGQVTQAVTFNHVQGQVTRLPLAAGDTGVQSVTSVLLSGSTGTAGNFGVVIAHRHAEFTPSGNCPEVLHPLFAGGAQEQAEILSGACLYFTSVSTTYATSFTIMRNLIVLVDN